MCSSSLGRAASVWLASFAMLGACNENPSVTSVTHSAVDGAAPSMGTLTGKVVATGIVGASAIRQVGLFLDTSPIATNVPFAAFTGQGQVLDPNRLLVASTSNYGAPRARPDHAPGAILSIAVDRAAPIAVPADFAQSGQQAAALDGAVRMYTAQSPNFLNRVYHADAVTADMPSVGNPLGISINNGFGRPWFANAPGAALGGTITVIDPDGRPLAAVVNPTIGGVFAGVATNRHPSIIEGSLATGCVGTALLGPSPDGSRRAVFAAVGADGSVVQVHVQLGVDGIAPPGTIQAVESDIERARQDASAAAVTHVGVVFNWVPSKALYIADPLRNTVHLLRLSQDASVFRLASNEALTSPYFDGPMDLAPAVTENVSRDFASGTTLAGGSDLYVLNRGNGTIVRTTQDGRVIAVRNVSVPGLGVVGRNRLNGIATARDASRIWVTLSAAVPDPSGGDGTVIELEAFGAE